MAAWFETRGVAALLTIRVQDLILRSALLCASRRPHPEEAPTGPREARPDDRLHAVSKDEVAAKKVAKIHDKSGPERILFSEKFACPVSGFTIPEIEPRLFSFNNPYGACPACGGLGV